MRKSGGHLIVLRILGATEGGKLMNFHARMMGKERTEGRSVIGEIRVAFEGRPGEEHLGQRIVTGRGVITEALQVQAAETRREAQPVGEAVEIVFGAGQS